MPIAAGTQLRNQPTCWALTLGVSSVLLSIGPRARQLRSTQTIQAKRDPADKTAGAGRRSPEGPAKQSISRASCASYAARENADNALKLLSIIVYSVSV